MTEYIIIAIAICISVVFMFFVHESVELTKHKKMLESYEKHAELYGDDDYIDREEFEEYKHMVNERFDKLEKLASIDYLELRKK